MMEQSRERSAYLLDVVVAVSSLAQEAVALRARVAVLEKANEDLMADWTKTTSRLQEAEKQNIEHEELENQRVNRLFPNSVVAQP
jgi:hypothetical protein